MLVYITGSHLKPGRISLIEGRFKIAVLSFRFEMEDKPDKTEILCLKTNLIPSNQKNPDQILCFMTAEKNQRFVTFTPTQLTPFPLVSRRIDTGRFFVTKLDGTDVELVQAALQITLRQIGQGE